LQKNEANSGLNEFVRMPDPPMPVQATTPSVFFSTSSICRTTPSVRSLDDAGGSWALIMKTPRSSSGTNPFGSDFPSRPVRPVAATRTTTTRIARLTNKRVQLTYLVVVTSNTLLNPR
jgi:hypothetical protein